MRARVAVVVTARPSWAKLLPICRALDANGHALDLIACAHAVTPHGSIVDAMTADGWPPSTVIHAAIDAHTTETSVLTTGLLMIRLAGHFATTRPAAVVVMADRYETLAVSASAAMLNLQVVHCQGGEVSGNIDQKIRYANTFLSDWHCVANGEAYARLIEAGVPIDRVWQTGCPSIDVCREAREAPPVTRDELLAHGTGGAVDPEQPFTLVVQHPVTARPDLAGDEIRAVLAEAESHGHPLIVLWPGADAGADESSRVVRTYPFSRSVRLLRSLTPIRYLRLLSQATLAVGNSSSLIREGSYFGIPRILTGDRQRGRTWTPGPSCLYGDGYAAPRIAEVVGRAVMTG